MNDKTPFVSPEARAYLRQAHETTQLVESPCERARLLGIVAARLQYIGDSDCLLVLEEACQSLEEAKAHDDDELHDTWFVVAEETLDPTLINQLPAQERSALLAERALRTNDPASLAGDNEGLDLYYTFRASRHGDRDAAYAIKDPDHRCYALLSLANHTPDPEMAEFYREEAWAAALSFSPENRAGWQRRIATHGSTLQFIDRIESPELRITVLRELGLPLGSDPSVELLTAIQQRLLYELSKKTLRPAIQNEITMLMHRIATRYLDKAFAELIPDPQLRRRTLKAIELSEAASQNDESIGDIPHDTPGRSKAIAGVAGRTGKLILALDIPEQHFRLQAIAGVAAKNNDQTLKEEVFYGVRKLLENLNTGGASSIETHNQIVEILLVLQDESMVKRLFSYPGTEDIVSDIIVETSNADLALLMPKGLARDTTLQDLTVNLSQPELITRIDDPSVRAQTYLHLYEKVTKKQ
ncbi:MAG TPA: hypothetical protein VF733_01870 [Candidatus Saccharimonadales bacterium]